MSAVEVLITYVGCKNTEVEFGRPTVSNRLKTEFDDPWGTLTEIGRETCRLGTVYGGALGVVLQIPVSDRTGTT